MELVEHIQFDGIAPLLVVGKDDTTVAPELFCISFWDELDQTCSVWLGLGCFDHSTWQAKNAEAIGHTWVK